MKPVLQMDGECGEDWIMRNGATYAWILIDKLLVRLKREDEGVVVDIYNSPHTQEWEDLGDPVASTYAFWDE